VDASVTIGARDARARDKLSQYIARGPIALGNVIYDAVKGRVIVKTRFNPWLKENLHLLDAEEFLARLTQFIPPARVRWIRYYGLYSLRSRGKWHLWPSVVAAAPEGWKRKHGAALPVPEPPVHRPPNPTWARLIAKVYEADPLACAQCRSDYPCFS
jgi:hypothetical protein